MKLTAGMLRELIKEEVMKARRGRRRNLYEATEQELRGIPGLRVDLVRGGKVTSVRYNGKIYEILDDEVGLPRGATEVKDFTPEGPVIGGEVVPWEEL